MEVTIKRQYDGHVPKSIELLAPRFGFRYHEGWHSNDLGGVYRIELLEGPFRRVAAQWKVAEDWLPDVNDTGWHTYEPSLDRLHRLRLLLEATGEDVMLIEHRRSEERRRR